MLLDLLKNIAKAVLAKDKPSLMVWLDSFQDFLKLALMNMTLTIDEQGVHSIQNNHQDNQALIELQDILTYDGYENFLLLYLGMELHRVKRDLDKEEYSSDFALKSLIFRNIIANLRPKGQNLASYDLSFLSSQARQTVLGKPGKSIFQPYLNIMESTFWHIDNGNVLYMTTAEKKPFKVKRNTDGSLIYSNTKKPVSDGRFLYIISPKGSLYIVEPHEFKGILHHSTVRAGQPVFCAGFLEIEQGEIYEIDHHSGHYKPDVQSLIRSCLHLYEQKIITETCMLRSPLLPSRITIQDINANESKPAYEL